ncbi:hypothetical protein BD408DRAFT_3039 [Parasitella parasitica]|nr:hypothetical protein BD408DRAFT_3039 [Parasitella parasitica]
MSILRDSRSPQVPSRSPFRIRDSQSKKQPDHDRWSFTVELVNMWNIKPDHGLYSMDSAKKQHQPHQQRQQQQQQQHPDTMLSSSHLLTQLLISQAILDSNDYEILTFDTLDKLTKVIQIYYVNPSTVLT